MKDEKKEALKCPACGIDNARNRITCQVCHERLIPNPAKLTETEKPEKKSRKKKDAPLVEREKVKTIEEDFSPESTPQNEVGERSLLTQSEMGAEQTTLPAKQRKTRKKRVKAAKENEPVFFVLTQGHLQAVHITYGTLKPIKRKELTITERNVLSIWNRNKDLINLN